MTARAVAMLEHQALWLGPWAASGRQPNWHPKAIAPPRWAVLDPVNRAYLGLVRRHVSRESNWFRWLSGGPTLEVCETEDESLLFTLERYWGLGPVWRVRDADNRSIGTVRRTLARDQDGQPLAVLDRSANDRSGRWVAPDGQELGTLTRADGGLLVSFAPCVEENPFIKMLLLATLFKEER